MTQKFTSARIALGVLLVVWQLAPVSAQHGDAALGTWDLDVAKSSFSPGPPVKSQTRSYEETPNGVKFTLVGVSADGKPMRNEFVAAYDGKDYPLAGNANVNSVSLTRVSPLRMDAVEKKDGNVVFIVTRVVSADAKTMTITVKGTNAKGQAVNNRLVFRRAS